MGFSGAGGKKTRSKKSRDTVPRPIFLGFCINQYGIGPLHYISSRSDFSFEFAEIFVIKNPSEHV